jgi:hypothetical protein
MMTISAQSTFPLDGVVPHLVSCLSLLTPRFALFMGLVIVLATQYAKSPWRKVPPGPRGFPILGNALQLQDKTWLVGKDCKRKFGVSSPIPVINMNLEVERDIPEHIMYLNAFGQPILVFNSIKSASDLLDRRAHIYSDRPRFIVAHEILCGGLFTATMPYGEMYILCPPHIPQSDYNLNHSWRRTRRAAHEGLTKVAVCDYHPILRKESILLASALLENPDGLDKHFQRFAASAIMSILYDYPTLENEHDKTLTDIHAFIDRMSAASAPGAHLVELFPWMMHIPEKYVSIPPKYV